ncbi:MAG: tyrosine-type recombinase/integrase [Erysipelotrichaceae bacterium]|nr:tyrosine-type recombinase/integrase [Erysipelotrichaceae bacterium]
MHIIIITHCSIDLYRKYLLSKEKSLNTINKYVKDIIYFKNYINNTFINRKHLLAYKEYLSNRYLPSTVNCKISALNSYLHFMKGDRLKLSYIKVQHNSFISEDRLLNKEEYRRLLIAAKERNNMRLYYLMMTICSTGIRVSELRYITKESLYEGKVLITNKGKSRTILIPDDLCIRLKKYAENISEGPIFITSSGKPLNRSNIHHDMKKLCKDAKVDEHKVFPHNLRHLFALSYYSIENNISHLADILGHSSIETTRIYLTTSIKEHENILSKMKLII